MQKLVEKLQQEIESFVEQREALFLLIESRQEDAPLLAKLLTEIEKKNQTDIFFLLLTGFESPEQYAAAAVAELVMQHRLLSEELVQKGHPGLPPLPAELSDRGGGAAERLQAVGCAARALIPAGGGHRLIYILWPLSIKDPEQCAALFSAILPAADLPEWAHGTRIIARALPDQPHKPFPPLPQKRSQKIRCDFSPPAIRHSMESVAADLGGSLAERMHALLMLAALDHAEDRGAAALDKYEKLLAYFQETQNPTMEAVVLNHLGEVHHRRLDLPSARSYYESALVPAERSPVPLLLVLLARNLGDVAFLEERFPDAVEYYTQWRLLSERLGDPQGEALAIEKLSLAVRGKSERGGPGSTAPARSGLLSVSTDDGENGTRSHFCHGLLVQERMGELAKDKGRSLATRGREETKDST